MLEAGRRCGMLVVAAALLVLSAGGGAAADEVQTETVGDGEGGVELKLIASFEQPVYVVGAPGRANRRLLFVVEQNGVVRVLRHGRTLRKPFLDLRDEVRVGFTQGLLSIAFDPDYARNRRLYAYFTDAEGDIRVSQFRRRTDSRTVAGGRERNVVEIPTDEAAATHDGGTVTFGPDGHMYLATGDGGVACDTAGNAQDRGSLLGKLLRIDPRRARGYTVPADNPFVGSPGRDEIYSLGFRNPYRFSIDERSSSIAIGDVGQEALEEVNYLELSAARAANFGWNRFEGAEPAPCGNDGGSPAPADHTEPIYQYRHEGPAPTGCAITGGSVVRDPRLPSLYGRYVFADFCSGQLRSLIPDADGAADEKAVGVRLDGPTALVTTRRERLYVTALSGGLYRVRAAG